MGHGPDDFLGFDLVLRPMNLVFFLGEPPCSAVAASAATRIDLCSRGRSHRTGYLELIVPDCPSVRGKLTKK